MERQIERILNRVQTVQSLDDLSFLDVTVLRNLSHQCLVLDKFKISHAQYHDWLDKVGHNIRGVEYDAQNARIVLKGGPGWVRETAAGLSKEFLGLLRDKLSAATGSPYFLTVYVGPSADRH